MAAIDQSEQMRSRAQLMRNGLRGDIDALSEGVADLLDAVATIMKSGYVTPAECAAQHSRSRFGWPAFCAVLAACGTVIGIVHMVFA